MTSFGCISRDVAVLLSWVWCPSWVNSDPDAIEHPDPLGFVPVELRLRSLQDKAIALRPPPRLPSTSAQQDRRRHPIDSASNCIIVRAIDGSGGNAYDPPFGPTGTPGRVFLSRWASVLTVRRERAGKEPDSGCPYQRRTCFDSRRCADRDEHSDSDRQPDARRHSIPD